MGTQGLMATGVPPQPVWLLWIKIAILVLSLIILALAAWVLSLFDGYLRGGAPGMDIFITIFSFIIYGGAGALEVWAPQYFYRVGALVGYILTCIFWLTAWAWSASTASSWLGLGIFGGGPDDFGSGMAACAGLGALVWVLVIVHLAFFVRACLVDTTVSQAELGNVKPAQFPQAYQQQPYPDQFQAQQPYPPQPQQPYPVQPQQPYPPQQYPPAQQPYPQ
ncbi:hypothetical protein VTK26DRAFT_2959 [Humicola hyalothermophila]